MVKKKKVLIITSIVGGLAHYVSHLQEPLKKKYELFFITYKKNYVNNEPVEGPGDNLIKNNIKNPQYLIEHDNPASIFRILEFIKKNKIDLVNIHFGTTGKPVFMFYSILMEELRKRKIPTILYCHDVLGHTPSEYEVESLHLVYDQADHFIVGSDVEGAKLKKHFKVPDKKVTLIKHGVYNKFDKGKFSEKSARKKLGLEKKKVILFFGFLRRYKGIMTLIKAMPQVTKKHKDVILHIAGSSNFENLNAQIKGAIKQSKIEKNVIFYDKYISIDEIEEFHKASDIIALPYTSISQSGVLALSMYFKKPVVISDIFPEAKKVDQKMGLVVPPNAPGKLAKALNILLDDPETSREYGRAGRDYIENTRSWDTIGDDMSAIFDRFLK